jgi:hypothetical protein
MAEKDNKWFEVISGKSKPNPKNKDEIEAAQLREAIGSYEKSIGLSKITPDNSYFRFQQLLKASHHQKASIGFIGKLKKYRWETARIIAATAAGIVIATLPTVQMATRGGSESVLESLNTYLKNKINKEDTAPTLILKIKEKNPILKIREISEMASLEKLTYKVETTDATSSITIYGLVADSEKQETFKISVGIPPKTDGAVTLIITKK